MNKSQQEFGKLVHQAVTALLQQIVADPKGYPGISSAGAIQGTTAYFTAQAVRNLMENPYLGSSLNEYLKSQE